MKEIFNLYNNKKAIGKVSANLTNIKKYMLLAGLGYVLLTTTGCGREEELSTPLVTVEEIPELDEVNETYENTYKVDYEVKFGDTLTGIIYSYESDANKVYEYIDDIVRLNDLNSQNNLRQGSTITLVGVPESKLEEFGYSADYDLFPAEYELQDRAAFVSKQCSYDYLNEEYLDEVTEIKIRAVEAELDLEAYLNSEDKNEETLDYLLEEYRELCDLVAKYMGTKFEKYLVAHPLSEAINNSNSMTY